MADNRAISRFAAIFGRPIQTVIGIGIADALYGDWQDEFTLVQWDQRVVRSAHASLPLVAFHGPAHQRAAAIAATLTNRLNSCNVKSAFIGPQRARRANASAAPPLRAPDGVARERGGVRGVVFFPPERLGDEPAAGPPAKKSSPGPFFSCNR